SGDTHDPDPYRVEPSRATQLGRKRTLFPATPPSNVDQRRRLRVLCTRRRAVAAAWLLGVGPAAARFARELGCGLRGGAWFAESLGLGAALAGLTRTGLVAARAPRRSRRATAER